MLLLGYNVCKCLKLSLQAETLLPQSYADRLKWKTMLGRSEDWFVLGLLLVLRGKGFKIATVSYKPVLTRILPKVNYKN